MRLILSLALFFCLLLQSGCANSECEKIMNEHLALEEKYELSLEKERKLFRSRFLERQEAFLEASNKLKPLRFTELNECMANPYSYFQKSRELIRILITGGNPNANLKGILEFQGKKSVCRTLVDDKIDFPTPPFDESDRAKGDLSLLNLSLRIIKNNPQCFSATEVARAEQELDD